MYSNYQNMPMYRQNNRPFNQNRPVNQPFNPNFQNDDRLIGGFAFPFLLGGVTGAALAPAFWRPNYGYRPYPYPYYPPYGPYYR